MTFVQASFHTSALIILCILSATSLTDAAVTPASVRSTEMTGDLVYIAGATPMGNFFTYKGKRVPDDQTYLILNLKKECECRVACWAHTVCRSSSFRSKGDGLFECRLSRSNPVDYLVEDDPESTFIYFVQHLPAKVIGLKEDGLLYLKFDYWRGYSEIRSYCSRLPGFRFAMFKTPLQLDIMQELAQTDFYYMGVDLQELHGGASAAWGDGTPLDMQELQKRGISVLFDANTNDPNFGFRHNNLIQRPSSEAGQIPCQANLYGVEW